MANKKYVMLSLDDEKLGVLAEVLSNKTSKKIIEYLAEKEASETEISRDLKLPANTVNYNIKKLVESGLIEKSKNYLWSIRGKRIVYYKVAKKSIMISPKTQNKVVLSVIAGTILTFAGAFLVNLFSRTNSLINSPDVYTNAVNRTTDSLVYESEKVVAAAGDMAPQCVVRTASFVQEPWFWFVIGCVTIGIFYILLSFKYRD